MMNNTIFNMTKLGYKFYFQDGDDQIACFNSFFSGKSEVYINDDLISRKRSFIDCSNITHSFDYGKEEFQVKFNMLNLLTGRLECTLFKSKQLIAQQVQCSIPNDPKKAAIFVSSCFLVGAVFGYTLITVIELITGML